MLKIDGGRKRLLVLPKSSVTALAESELSSLLRENADVLLREECGEDLFILGQNLNFSMEHDETIDALAIDAAGRGVVIDWGGDLQGHDITRAIAGAAVMAAASWQEDLLPLLNEKRAPECREFLRKHKIPAEQINTLQRLLIIRGCLPPQIVQTAAWLATHQIAITCYALGVMEDAQTKSQFICVTEVFPAKDEKKDTRKPLFSSMEPYGNTLRLEKVLAKCQGPLLKSFVERLFEERGAHVSIDGSINLAGPDMMRFRLLPLGDHAQVIQMGRFPGDEDHWEQLSARKSTADRDQLEFTIQTQEDIKLFEEFLLKAASTVWWLPMPNSISA